MVTTKPRLLDPTSPRDQERLQEYARNHPRAADKGLDKVVRVKLNSNKDGYVALLSDYTEIPFSKKYVGRKKTINSVHFKEKNVREAFRNEVLDQTRKVRFHAGYGGRGAEMHVGHVGNNEFKALCDKFLSNKGLSISNISVEKRKQRSHHKYDCWYFTNTELANSWSQFHQENAEMVMQTSHENLTRKRQKD